MSLANVLCHDGKEIFYGIGEWGEEGGSVKVRRVGKMKCGSAQEGVLLCIARVWSDMALVVVVVVV